MIKIKNLSFRYGRRSTDGISNISFVIPTKKVTALIGPSGAGKTTLLKCLSGEIIDYTGDVIFEENYQLSFLKNEEIHHKDKSLFEFLLDSITANNEEEQNLNQIRTLLSQLELTNEIDTEIQKLSSGQKQRALIAKALVNNPTVLLLDEPFANLDNNLRDLLLKDLFDLLQDKEITIVWVTHNTTEALKFADQIAILQFGQLEQVASPIQMYYEPSNIFVAQFLGSNNILNAKIVKRESNKMTIEVLEKKVEYPKNPQIDFDDILVMIRPEFFFISDSGHLNGEIEKLYFQGTTTVVEVRTSNHLIYLEQLGRSNLKVGQKVKFSFNTTEIYPLFT